MIPTILGGQPDEPATHRRRVRICVLALVLRPLDDRGRVDARRDRLRQVPQRARYRCALRRILLGVDARRIVQRPHRVRVVVQLKLQDVLEAILGGADDHV